MSKLLDNKLKNIFFHLVAVLIVKLTSNFVRNIFSFLIYIFNLNSNDSNKMRLPVIVTGYKITWRYPINLTTKFSLH